MPSFRPLVLALLLALAGCPATPPADDDGPPRTDAGPDASPDAPAPDLAADPRPDTPPDVTADTSDAADAPPATTTITVTLGGVTRTLDRAQLGLVRDQQGQVTGLYVEAHAGGDPACPDETSPTPDQTLILAGIPLVAEGSVVTPADGLRVTLFDFTGELFPGPEPERFEDATLTLGRVITDPPEAAWLEATLEATSPAGTVGGTLYAPRCASLDG